MMSAVEGEKPAADASPTTPAAPDESKPIDPKPINPKPNAPGPSAPAASSKSPPPPPVVDGIGTLTPPVVHGIEGTAPPPAASATNGGPKRPEKWETSVNALKGWFSEALQVTKETAQTAQRAVASVGVRRDMRPRILCVGDSLTERADALDASAGGPGWSALLRARYGGRGEVLTRGASGYNSRWGLSVLPRVLHSLEPACVRVALVWYGANDAVAAGGPQHVPLDEYRYNLTKLANFVYAFKGGAERAVPVLVTPPAVCDAMRWRETGGEPKRSAARMKEYADACVEVACGLKVPFVDVHSEMMAKAEGDAGEKGVGRFLSDGLHLNAEGNALVERLVVEVLESHFKKWAPSTVSAAFPPWSEINVQDPEATLGPVLQL